MTSERALLTACLLAAGIGCAPLERGEPRVEPDAGAVMGGDAGMTGDAGGAGGPSFASDVHPLLLMRCGPCHREGGPGAASKRYVLTEDAENDRQTVLKLVNTADPDKSWLLRKARGDMHTGGKVLPIDSANYASVRAWIAAGAPP